MSETPATNLVLEFQDSFQRIQSELAKVIIGHEELIRNILIAFFAGGHVLIEGRAGNGQNASGAFARPRSESQF